MGDLSSGLVLGEGIRVVEGVVWTPNSQPMLITTGKVNLEQPATYQPRCSRPLRRDVLSRGEDVSVDATLKIWPNDELTRDNSSNRERGIRIAEVVCTSYSQVKETKCALAGSRRFVCGGQECGARREEGRHVVWPQPSSTSLLLF